MGMNINNATKRELTSIFGIGDRTADKIIEFREDNGEIRDIEELRGYEGIEEELIYVLKHSLPTSG